MRNGSNPLLVPMATPMMKMSQFNQRMVVHSKDEALMCKIFPSSLGPVAMRWFNGLRADSINSFKELT